jgi:hypothetical protein
MEKCPGGQIPPDVDGRQISDGKHPEEINQQANILRTVCRMGKWEKYPKF